MSVIRTFVAIDLPDRVQSCLKNISEDLQSNLESIPIRWVPVENIHMTLKFLGDVSINNIELLKKMLRSEAQAHSSFEIGIGGIGAYPKIRRPRVIWTGVEAPSELVDLQQSIEAQTSKLGYAVDNREFSPHLTLGRVSRNASPEDVRKVGEVLSSYKVGFLGAARVTEVCLFRSDLQSTGAVYTKLFTVQLAE